MRGDKWFALALLTPSLFLIGLVVFFPLSYSIYTSLFDRIIYLPSGKFVGLQNYAAVLNDPEFVPALTKTIIWTAFPLFFHITLGILGALLLNQDFEGRAVVRGIVTFPYLVPTVVAALVWSWMYNPTFGIFNYILTSLNFIQKPIIWLGVNDALLSVMIVTVWRYVPFSVICFLARLQTIPPALYEAAKIDGASSWRQFRDVTIPQLRNVILLVVVIRAVWMFVKFDEIWVMTQGGPGDATRVFSVWAYIIAFGTARIGLASALGVIMLVALVGLVIVSFKWRREQ